MTEIMNQIMNDYEIVVMVGSGSFGEVYKAKNRITGEVVGLKKFREERHIAREAGAYTLLSRPHENICLLITRFPNWLVFEYCESDLESVVVHERLSWDQKMNFMIQILNGVRFIHSRGLIHRDLKPPNILMDRHGVLKIADFGLTIPFDQLNKSSKICTDGYRPPELVPDPSRELPSDYGYEVDIWSLACIFFFIVTGRHFNDKRYVRVWEHDPAPGICREVETDDGRGKMFSAPFDVVYIRDHPDEFPGIRELLLLMFDQTPAARPTADRAFALLNTVSPEFESTLSVREIHQGRSHHTRQHIVPKELKPIRRKIPPAFWE